MTLDTRFAITSPMLNPREVFDHCNVLLAAAAGWPVERIAYDADPSAGWINERGQGLPAWLDVTYGPDGPMTSEGAPAAFVMVSFDTAYGYRSPAGLGCNDLHAGLIDALGEWCDRRGLSWSWYDEFRGEWHAGRDGLAEFGDAAAARREWSGVT